MVFMRFLEDRVLRYLDFKRDEIVDFLQRLIRIKSVVGEEYEAQRFMYKMFCDMGVDVDVWEPNVDELKGHPGFFETTSYLKYGYRNRPNVIGRLSGVGGGRSLFLCGHVDVVSPEPIGEWTYPPWGGVIVGDRVYGRGACDQKGGIAAMVYALKSIIDLGIKLKGDVLIGSTIEEEDGGVGGALAVVVKGYRADAAIFTEPTGEIGIGLASAGVMYFRVKIFGKSVHAARAHLGVNAIEKAFKVYRVLMDLNEGRQRRIFYPYVESDPCMRGRATTINVGVIRGGDWPSTVAGWVEMECRIGWPPGESIDQVKREVEEALGGLAVEDPWFNENPLKIDWFGWRCEPSEQDVNHPFVQLVRNVVEEVVGGRVIFTGGSAGLDTRHFILYGGIPSIAYGPRGGNTHGVDEYVEIDSVVNVAKVLALTLLRWCNLQF